MFPPPTKLHLVAAEQSLSGAEPASFDSLSQTSSETEHVRLGLERLMSQQAGVVPDDPSILRWAWPDANDIPSSEAMRAGIDMLIYSGCLRRIVLGTEPHLTFTPQPEPQPAASIPAPRHSLQVPVRRQNQEPSQSTSSWSLTQEAFELQVEMDVDHERLLLFRIMAIVGAVGLMVLTREVALVLLEL